MNYQQHREGVEGFSRRFDLEPQEKKYLSFVQETIFQNISNLTEAVRILEKVRDEWAMEGVAYKVQEILKNLYGEYTFHVGITSAEKRNFDNFSLENGLYNTIAESLKAERKNFQDNPMGKNKMAKILIYEDNEQDLINRYSRLATKHEIHVRHSHRPLFGAGMLSWDYEEFRKQGFNTDNFREGFTGLDKDAFADVYFLDGLEGFCFTLLEKGLPKDKSYIYSDSVDIIDLAKQKGYNIVEESVDKMVTDVLVNQAFREARERVRQIEAKALSKLRHPSQVRKKDF